MDDHFVITDDVVATANAKLDKLFLLIRPGGPLCRHDRHWLIWVDRHRDLLPERPTIVIHINILHNKHCRYADEHLKPHASSPERTA